MSFSDGIIYKNKNIQEVSQILEKHVLVMYDQKLEVHTSLL